MLETPLAFSHIAQQKMIKFSTAVLQDEKTHKEEWTACCARDSHVPHVDPGLDLVQVAAGPVLGPHQPLQL